MTNFTDMTGLAGTATAMTAAAFLLPGVARMPKSGLVLLVSAVVMAAMVPIAGLPAAAYLRGIIGDLSITSLVLLMLAILRSLFGWRSSGTNAGFTLQILITVAALELYPFALGLGYFDPYRLGYGNLWFLSVLLLVALAACFRQTPVIALCLALAVFAWDIGWYESNNLWDYLLDPLLAIYAISAVMKRSIQMQWKRQQG